MSEQKQGRQKKKMKKRIAILFSSCFQICQRWKVKPVKMLVNTNSSWLTIQKLRQAGMGFYPNHFSPMPRYVVGLWTSPFKHTICCVNKAFFNCKFRYTISNSALLTKEMWGEEIKQKPQYIILAVQFHSLTVAFKCYMVLRNETPPTSL